MYLVYKVHVICPQEVFWFEYRIGSLTYGKIRRRQLNLLSPQLCVPMKHPHAFTEAEQYPTQCGVAVPPRLFSTPGFESQLPFFSHYSRIY